MTRWKSWKRFLQTENATFNGGWTLLEKTAGLKFTASQAAAELTGSPELDADSFLSIIDTLRTLDDNGCWAARALFKVPKVSGQDLVRGLTCYQFDEWSAASGGRKGL